MIAIQTTMLVRQPITAIQAMCFRLAIHHLLNHKLCTEYKKQEEAFLRKTREPGATQTVQRQSRNANLCTCNHFGSTHKTFRFLCNDGLYAIMACTRAAAAIVKTKSTHR